MQFSLSSGWRDRGGALLASLATAAVFAASPVSAETVILGSPSALYSFDTSTGATTAFGAAVRGNVTGWAAPRPIRQIPDGSLVCTADSAGAYCVNASTKALVGAVSTALSMPYGWDVSQDGKRLVSSSVVTLNGSNVQGAKIVNLQTGADIASLGLETYAVAVSPSSATASLLAMDVSDTSAIFQGKIPYLIATVDLSNGAITKSVPLKAADGTRLYGPWALHGIADTGSAGAANYVIWNKGGTVMVVSADGIVTKSVAAPGVNTLSLSQDGTVAFAATGTKAQRISLANGTVTNDYVDGQVTSASVSAAGDVLYTAGPVGGLPASTVGTWSLASGTLSSRQATSDAAITTVAAVPAVRRLATPEVGWWWEPANGGTGFSIECSSSNGRCFIGDFTYNTAGQAVWYVTSCALTTSNTCTGPIDEYRNGISLGGAYQAPTATPGAGGTMTVAFTSSTTATVTVTGRPSFSIQRYAINGTSISAPPAFAPQAGWWWSADEGGRGWFVETQNSVVQSGTTYGQAFVAGYMYETTGRPVWYIAQGLYTSVGTFGGSIPLFEATLTEFSGGPPLSGGAGTGLVVAGGRGMATIQFTSATTGSIRLPNGRSVAITRFAVP